MGKEIKSAKALEEIKENKKREKKIEVIEDNNKVNQEKNKQETDLMNISETLQIPQINYDYSNVEDEETVKYMQNSEIIMFTAEMNKDYIFGERLAGVQEKLANNKTGEFEKWYTALGLKKQRVYDYINYYSILSARADNIQLQSLPYTKIAQLSGITKEQQEDIIENAPLNEMTKEEIKELKKQVKSAGEYSDELLEQVKQKDKKLQEQEENQNQKDQQIQELQQKIQQLENEKVQPVEQVETQVIEKIVEVEKIVEKEVIPSEVEEELKELRAEKKRLEEETAEKTNYIKQQAEEINEANQTLKNLKADNEEIQSDFDKTIDIGILFSRIKQFLDTTSSYTLLRSQYANLSEKNKKTLYEAVYSVKEWCNSMEEALSTTIIESEVENK